MRLRHFWHLGIVCLQASIGPAGRLGDARLNVYIEVYCIYIYKYRKSRNKLFGM